MEWSPVATTLIYGKRDAVLVDPPFTTDTASQMLAWVEKIGRVITDVYITHGHGDHWLGVPVVLERFPDALVHATAGTKAHIDDFGAAQYGAEFWNMMFPGQIPAGPVDVQVVGEEGLSLEGHALIPVEVGHSDSDDTTVLWVPSLKLAVAGDVVYSGVHLPLIEAAEGGLDAWRRALDKVEALGAEVVVASHQDPTRPNDPANVGHTRRYLDDVDRVLEASTTPMELFEEMTRLHPERINPGILWFGALALVPGGDAQ